AGQRTYGRVFGDIEQILHGPRGAGRDHAFMRAHGQIARQATMPLSGALPWMVIAPSPFTRASAAARAAWTDSKTWPSSGNTPSLTAMNRKSPPLGTTTPWGSPRTEITIGLVISDSLQSNPQRVGWCLTGQCEGLVTGRATNVANFAKSRRY